MLNPNTRRPAVPAKELSAPSLQQLITKAMKRQKRINVSIRLLRICYQYFSPTLSDYLLKQVRLSLVFQVGQLEKFMEVFPRNMPCSLSNVLSNLLLLSRETVCLFCARPTDDLLTLKQLLPIAGRITDLTICVGNALADHRPVTFPEPISLN